MKQILTFLLLLCLAASGATLPTAPPAHSGLSALQTSAYSADYMQRMMTGSGVATLPTAAPAHRNLSLLQTEQYIADYLQDISQRKPVVINVTAYGAIPNDGVDDLFAFNAAYNAQVAAGGGDIYVPPGVWDITPVAGKAIMADGSLGRIYGAGLSSVIKLKATGSSTAFVGIANVGYDTATVAYGAKPLWIENLAVTVDDSTNLNCHDLWGVAHAPWAMFYNVWGEQGRFHCFEVNLSKNVWSKGGGTFGTNNFRSSIIEIDPRGGFGIISGTPPQTTPLSSIVIEGFVQSGPRQDLTIDPSPGGFCLLTHTVSTGVYRDITIKDCVIVPHCNTTLTPGVTRSEICFDTMPAEMTGLNIVGNVFAGPGLTGSTILIDLSVASSATMKVDNIVVKDNIAQGGCLRFVQTGCNLGDTNGLRTTVSANDQRAYGSVVIENNYINCTLNGNTVAAARATRLFDVGPCMSAAVRGNTLMFPASPIEVGWGSSSIAAANYAFFLDHPVNLEFSNNIITMATPSATINWWAIFGAVFSCSAYEVGTPVKGLWKVEGNNIRSEGTTGNNLAGAYVEMMASGTTGMPQWVSKTPSAVTWKWLGNRASGSIIQTLETSTCVPMSAWTTAVQTTAGAAALGYHEGRPGAESIGAIYSVLSGAPVASGCFATSGQLVSGLPWQAQAQWTISQAQAGTTLPSIAGQVIRLSGQ